MIKIIARTLLVISVYYLSYLTYEITIPMYALIVGVPITMFSVFLIISCASLLTDKPNYSDIKESMLFIIYLMFYWLIAGYEFIKNGKVPTE